MIEYLLKNWITAAICTIAILALWWYPPVQCDGNLFDSAKYRLITIVLACVNGLALTVLSLRYLPFGRANRIVPFCYLFFIFSFPQARAFSAAFPAALFVVLGLYALFKSGETKSSTAPFFTSSFLVGCACLFYTTSWVAVVCFAVMAIALNLLYGRNILVFLGGFLLPIGCFLLYRHLFVADVFDFIKALFDGSERFRLQPVPRIPATLFLVLVYIYLFFRLLMRWLSRSFGNKSYRYRVLASIVWMMVVCGIPAIFLSDKVVGYLPVMAIPASLLMSYYFSEERITKRMKVEFTVLLLAVMLNQVAFFL